jgi:ATP-dependent DNA helicase RecG
MGEQLNIPFGEKLPLLSPDDIYQEPEMLLTLVKEDRRLERKPPGVQGRLLGEYFSMWANTSPEGGIIVVGLEDKGAISGCVKLSSGQLNDLEKSPRIYCPDARVDSKRVPVIDETGHENFVVLFRVYYREDKVVFDVSNTAYTRIGDEKHKLTADEVREFQI